MKRIYQFHYRMRGGGGQLSTLPVYSANLDLAKAAFHRRMGEFGCEGNSYRVDRVVSHETQSINLTLAAHRRIIDRLTDEDRQE